MKLCSNCRFYQPSLTPTQCRAPGNSQPDYVHGGSRIIFISAQPLRLDPRYCGPDAVWFEARTEVRTAA